MGGERFTSNELAEGNMRSRGESGFGQAVVVLVLGALLAIGCSSRAGSHDPAPATAAPLPAPADDAGAAARLAETLRAPYTPASTDAMVEALARAGIEVYADDGKSLVREVVGPRLGIRVLRFQARGLALELAGRGGTRGAVLDEHVAPLPLPDGGKIPLSALLAAYTKTGGRFGAELSSALLREDLDVGAKTRRYPALVQLLAFREVIVPMVAAAVREGTIPAVRTQSFAPSFPSSLHGLANGAPDPCGAISDFLDDAPGAVEKAVTALASDDGGFLSFVMSGAGKIAGAVTELAANGVRELLKNIPFMEAFRLAGDITSALADVRAMTSQWTVEIKPGRDEIHKSVKTPNGVETPNDDTFTLTMSNGDPSVEYPPSVESCADLFGIALPQIGSADGATVKWTPLTGIPSLATERGKTEVITNNSAKYDVRGAPETRALHDGGGPVQRGKASVRADVSLPGLEQLAQRLLGYARAPAVAAAIAARGAEAAAEVLGPTGSGEISVSFHGQTASTIHVVDGDVTFHAVSCTGINGPYNGRLSVPGGSGPVSFTFDPTTKVAPVSTTFPVPNATYSMDGTMTLGGTEAAPTVTADVNVTVATSGGTSGGKFGGTYPVTLGPAPECL